MTSRKLQIFKFVLIEMFSPCVLNSRVISFLSFSSTATNKIITMQQTTIILVLNQESAHRRTAI